MHVQRQHEHILLYALAASALALSVFLYLSLSPASPESASNTAAAARPFTCMLGALPGVIVALKSDLKQTVPDAVLGFEAEIVNSEESRVSDGAMYIRVMSMSEEPIVVDEFVAARGIDVDGEALRSVTFEWNVPLGIANGRYVMEAYLMSPGAPFIPLVGETREEQFEFSVTSTNSAQPFIDTKLTTIDGIPYSSQWPVVEAGSSTSAVVKVWAVNPTDEPFEGRLIWRLYERGLSPLSEPLDVREVEVRLHPQDSMPYAYVFVSESGSPHYLEVELQGGGARSRAGIFMTGRNECPDGATGEAGERQSGLPSAFLIAIGIIVALGVAWEVWRKESLAHS